MSVPTAGLTRVEVHETQETMSYPPEESEYRSAAGMAGVVRHLAWLAAPTAEIELDREHDLLIVTFFEGAPDVEIDPDDRLAVGFHRSEDRYLLTTLCLRPASLADLPGRLSSTVRDLLGESVWRTAEQPAAAEVRTIALGDVEVEGLVDSWRRFVATALFKPAP